MSETVSVYLDVDGVLNAVTAGTPRDWGWTKSRKVRVNGFGITYAPELIERINTLAGHPRVQVYWLTTWEDDAARDLAPAIGLNGEDWPVLGVNEHRTLMSGWWKFEALREHHEARFGVWIDDDLASEPEAQEWVDQTEGLIAFPPAPHKGITRDQWDIVEAYVASAISMTEAAR